MRRAGGARGGGGVPAPVWPREPAPPSGAFDRPRSDPMLSK